MGKFFDLDNPVMRGLSTVADLMILNFWTAICCIPIFTIGASFTALHYVLLKMVRNEEGYITKSFFKSFKENFKQATGIWAIMLAAAVVLIGDYYVFKQYPDALPKPLMVVILALGILLYLASTFVFPLLSHFSNSVSKTLKNAASFMVLHIPTAFLMGVLYILPIVGIAFITPYLYPLIFLFGLSVPAYASAWLYSRIFKQFDQPEEETAASDMEFDIAPENDSDKESTVNDEK